MRLGESDPSSIRESIRAAITEMDRAKSEPDLDIYMRGPLQKIAWADENLQHFGQVIQDFLNKHPFQIVEDINQLTGNKHFQIKYSFPFPRESAGRFIGYALYDLRSALEHMAVIAARVSNQVDIRQVNFPFAPTKKLLNERLYKEKSGRKPLCHYVGQNFAQFIEDQEPCEDGNKFLWDFGKISNHDRHIEILPTTANVMPVSYGKVVANGGVDGQNRTGTVAFVANAGNPEYGITISIGGPDATFSIGDSQSPDISTNTDVLFSGTQVFEGASVYQTVSASSKMIRRMIEEASVLLCNADVV